MKKLLLTTALCLLLTACGEGSASKAKKENEEKIKHVTLQEAAEDLKNFDTSAYENLVFECTPTPIEAEHIYTLELSTNTLNELELTDEEREQLTEKMIAKEKEVFGIEIDKSELDQSLPSEIIFFKQGVAALHLDINGSFTFTDHRSGAPAFQRSDELGNKLDMDTYTDLSVPGSRVLKINGKDVDVCKAGKNAEEQFRKYFSEFLREGEEIVAVDAIGMSKDPETGSYTMLLVRLTHTFEGLTVNENGRYHSTEYREFADEYIFRHYSTVYMTGEDEIIWFLHGGSLPVLKKEPVEKIIPLSAAARIAGRSIADNLRLKVKEAELKYVTVLDSFTQRNADGGRDMRPMWSFVTNRSADGIEINTTMILIDAIDGTVYYCTPDFVDVTEPILD